MRPCYYCEKETKNPKFCSRSCSAMVGNRVAKRKRKKTFCFLCGSLLPMNKMKNKFCDTCFSLAQGRRQQRTIGEIQGRAKYQHSRQIRDGARDAMLKTSTPQKCRACAYDKHVEVCHIKAVSSFPSSATIAEVNALVNLVYLCPNCHYEFDHGRLSLP